jgi:hypothetical protein
VIPFKTRKCSSKGVPIMALQSGWLSASCLPSAPSRSLAHSVIRSGEQEAYLTLTTCWEWQPSAPTLSLPQTLWRRPRSKCHTPRPPVGHGPHFLCCTVAASPRHSRGLARGRLGGLQPSSPCGTIRWRWDSPRGHLGPASCPRSPHPGTPWLQLVMNRQLRLRVVWLMMLSKLS